MSKHIKFDGFKCDKLQYVKQGNTWICLTGFMELDDVEFCFRCKFTKQLKREKLIREGKLHG